jgi:hypothetical protein
MHLVISDRIYVQVANAATFCIESFCNCLQKDI